MNNYAHKFLESTIGAIFGKDITCREPVHRCDAYQPGVLTEFGRTGIKLFKKFLMPCGLCATVPAMKPNTPDEHTTPCSNETQTKKLIKPSELPIYPIEDVYSKQMPCVQYPSVVEENIRKIRLTVTEIKGALDRASHEVTNGVENVKFLIDYLQDPANLAPRIGAVGIGGLTGLVIGLRGGMLKRLVYTTIGASTFGCVCFPNEAQQAVNTVQRYGNITANFIYGANPEHPRTEIITNISQMLRNLVESEHFSMLTSAFKQKTSNTTEIVEKKPSTKESKEEVE